MHARIWKVSRIAGFLIALGFIITSTAHAQDYVPGEVIVKFKSQDTGKMSSQKSASKAASFEKSKKFKLKKSWKSFNTHHFKIDKNKNVEDTIAELQNDPEVEYAEPNYILRKSNLDEPEGIESLAEAEASSEESGLAGALSMTGADIDMPLAWGALSGSSAKPIVAVIDTGMDLDHAALADIVWVNPGEIANNGIDDDGNGYVDDVNGWNFANYNNNPNDCDGHGTHVAGIVRGATQSLSITPSAPLIEIMPVKFLDCNGYGATSDAINAIYYAVNNGATILNNSWGGSSYSNALVSAIVYSYNAKTSFIAAAGNSGTNNDVSPMYPASYSVPNIVSVSATTDSDSLASFSNYGFSKVHLASPGVSIYSSYMNNQFAWMSGTSMATPFVAGVVSIMAREQPSMNGYQLKQLLLGSTDVLGSLNGKVLTSGRLNAYTSLQAAQASSVSSYMPSYTGERSPSAISANGGGCGMVEKVYTNHSQNQSKLSQKNPPMTYFLAVLVLFLAPFALGLLLNGRNRRRYERYVLNTDVDCSKGKQAFCGHVGTISMGGLELQTKQYLKLGDTFNLEIQYGNDVLEIKGKVVWAVDCKKYGVSFVKIKEQNITTISQWIQDLIKC